MGGLHNSLTGRQPPPVTTTPTAKRVRSQLTADLAALLRFAAQLTEQRRDGLPIAAGLDEFRIEKRRILRELEKLEPF